MTTATSSGRGKQQQSRRAGQSTKTSERSSRTTRSNETTRSSPSASASQSTPSSQASRTKQSSQAKQPSQAKQSDGRQHAHSQVHSTTVDLPFVTAQFRIPDVALPTSREDLASAADSVRAQMPSRDHSLFYGGLALGTAFAFIEWPVALAIGVGHALLTRRPHQQESQASSRSSSSGSSR